MVYILQLRKQSTEVVGAPKILEIIIIIIIVIANQIIGEHHQPQAIEDPRSRAQMGIMHQALVLLTRLISTHCPTDHPDFISIGTQHQDLATVMVTWEEIIIIGKVRCFNGGYWSIFYVSWAVRYV